MITHRIHLSRSPAAVRVEQQAESFVRETGPTAVELPDGGPPPAAMGAAPNAAASAQAAEHESAVRETIQALFDEIRELEERRRQSIDELRELAVEIACAITTHVLDDALARDQFPLEKLIAQAIEHLGVTPSDDVIFKLNPDDCQAIERVSNELEKAGNLPPRMKWQPDPTLERGSCEATLGERGVLVDIHDQLNQIRHELLGTLDHAQTERRDTAQSDRHVQRYPNRRDTA